MAYTSADLIVIERAIVRGETTVQFADRMVVYKSTTDLLRAKAEIIAGLAAATRKRQSLGVADKGFRS